jgi:hypothetical protein
VWALLAASAAEGALDHVVAYGMDSNSGDAGGLRNLVPGLFKLGGVATAVALTAPTPVLVVGSDPAFAGGTIDAAYAAAGAPKGFQRDAAASVQQMVSWLDGVGAR